MKTKKLRKKGGYGHYENSWNRGRGEERNKDGKEKDEKIMKKKEERARARQKTRK